MSHIFASVTLWMKSEQTMRELCSFALELRAYYATTRASNKWVIDSKHKIFEREILHNIATIKHRLSTINRVHIMLSMKTGDSAWHSSLREHWHDRYPFLIPYVKVLIYKISSRCSYVVCLRWTPKPLKRF